MGEHLALDVGVLAAILLTAVLVFVAVSIRRWLFERSGGTVECGLRTLPSTRSDDAPETQDRPGKWRSGICRYKGDELHWYRMFGFRRRPRQVIHRRGLVVSKRRDPEDDEVATLGPGTAIIEVRDADLTVELAMSTAALTGFLSWIEAAPPGFPVDFPN